MILKAINDERVYDFQDSYAFSVGTAEQDDMKTIKNLISNCAVVERCTTQEDRNGNDYRARLVGGAEILIDVKSRRAGCSKYWKDWPDVPIETWSVMPGGVYSTPECQAKIGWTLCQKKQTDYILFKFHPSDSMRVFLVSYQLLRMAAQRFVEHWRGLYKPWPQSTSGNGIKWQSEAIFVPINVVYAAIIEVSTGQLQTA